MFYLILTSTLDATHATQISSLAHHTTLIHLKVDACTLTTEEILQLVRKTVANYGATDVDNLGRDNCARRLYVLIRMVAD